MSSLILGPDGRPFDRRSPEQAEFDRRLRQQMGDNGGQFLPRRTVEAIQRELGRRPKFDPAPEPVKGNRFEDMFPEKE